MNVQILIPKKQPKTERNFKLAKDETTVTLEKVKLENVQSSTNLQTIMSLLKLKDKEE